MSQSKKDNKLKIVIKVKFQNQIKSNDFNIISFIK